MRYGASTSQIKSEAVLIMSLVKDLIIGIDPNGEARETCRPKISGVVEDERKPRDIMSCETRVEQHGKSKPRVDSQNTGACINGDKVTNSCVSKEVKVNGRPQVLEKQRKFKQVRRLYKN